MTTITQLLPVQRDVALDEVLASLRGGAALPPFDPAVVEFCAALARRLSRDAAARRFPALQALAFWMRRAELLRLRDELAALETPEVLLVPRGVAFHLPPANVDTIFVYSWLLSILAGNRNVIRLSSRRTEQVAVILRCFAEALAEAAGGPVAGNTIVVSYGHDREITAALTAACDLRVVWGGDATVMAIREIPLPPRARELAFPNRYSLAAVRADAYLALDAAGRDDLAERGYNDTYWFDQLGCSSPRVLVWVGARADSDAAAEDFGPRLARVAAAKGYAPETGVVLGKLTFAYRAAIDAPVSRVATLGNALTLLSLDELAALSREHYGGGILYQAHVDELTALRAVVRRVDQTLAHFGFPAGELRALARTLNGAGIDRMVPFGQALTFSRFWDGVDLLQEMTRRVVVQADARASAPVAPHA